jgi:glycosyltransferase involved in cell wall biosynthesis
MSIGAKLNSLMELARGDVLMRFDDDDYYAPDYVERMLELLGDDDYLTLSGWFAYSPTHGKFCYWETDVMSPLHFVLSP